VELQLLDPKAILWPENRVTAYYQDGQEEMLKENLAAMGQQSPLVVFKVGDQYWGTDGLHRCRAAIERGDATIPCVVKEGDEKDALMSNLVLNNLRGRTRASEQVAVLGELFDSLGVTIEELEAKTGHSRNWVEQMILVSRATNPVRQALDEEVISLGHAEAMARIKDTATQERVCYQLLLHRWTVNELREHIKGVEDQVVVAEQAPAPSQASPPALRTCGFCHHEEPSDKLAVVSMCHSCSGILIDYHRKQE
jgi:ParB family chromosome partitioning protein